MRASRTPAMAMARSSSRDSSALAQRLGPAADGAQQLAARERARTARRRHQEQDVVPLGAAAYAGMPLEEPAAQVLGDGVGAVEKARIVRVVQLVQFAGDQACLRE